MRFQDYAALENPYLTLRKLNWHDLRPFERWEGDLQLWYWTLFWILSLLREKGKIRLKLHPASDAAKSDLSSTCHPYLKLHNSNWGGSYWVRNLTQDLQLLFLPLRANSNYSDHYWSWKWAKEANLQSCYFGTMLEHGLLGSSAVQGQKHIHFGAWPTLEHAPCTRAQWR